MPSTQDLILGFIIVNIGIVSLSLLLYRFGWLVSDLPLTGSQKSIKPDRRIIPEPGAIRPSIAFKAHDIIPAVVSNKVIMLLNTHWKDYMDVCLSVINTKSDLPNNSTLSKKLEEKTKRAKYAADQFSQGIKSSPLNSPSIKDIPEWGEI